MHSQVFNEVLWLQVMAIVTLNRYYVLSIVFITVTTTDACEFRTAKELRL